MIRLNWNVYAIKKILIKCTFIGWSYSPVLHLIDIWKHDINKINISLQLLFGNFYSTFLFDGKKKPQNRNAPTKKKTQTKNPT